MFIKIGSKYYNLFDCFYWKFLIIEDPSTLHYQAGALHGNLLSYNCTICKYNAKDKLIGTINILSCETRLWVAEYFIDRFKIELNNALRDNEIIDLDSFYKSFEVYTRAAQLNRVDIHLHNIAANKRVTLTSHKHTSDSSKAISEIFFEADKIIISSVEHYTKSLQIPKTDELINLGNPQDFAIFFNNKAWQVREYIDLSTEDPGNGKTRLEALKERCIAYSTPFDSLILISDPNNPEDIIGYYSAWSEFCI